MARKFEELRAKMTPERRVKVAKMTQELNAELPLHQLRRALRLTQEQLAEQLGVTQATLSKMENNPEKMLITTLQRIVRAMGGELELKAHFPQGDVTLNDLERALA